MKLGLALSHSSRLVWGSGVVNGEAALVGQSVTVSKGTLRANLLQTFTDNFATLDANKWNPGNINGTVSIVSGQLDLTTDSTAASGAWVNSDNVYDFVDSEAYVKLVRPLLGTNDIDSGRTIFRIESSTDAGDYVEWFVQTDGVVCARTVENGGAPTHNTVISSDWSTSGFAWLKMSLSGGTVTWWTAPDSAGSPGTWTSRHTNATLPAGFGGNVKVTLSVDYWGTGAGTITESAQFDGLNTSVS